MNIRLNGGYLGKLYVVYTSTTQKISFLLYSIIVPRYIVDIMR
jgi:hypothetical protein